LYKKKKKKKNLCFLEIRNQQWHKFESQAATTK